MNFRRTIIRWSWWRGRQGDPSAAVSWVTAAPTEAIPGLARKLPHYTRYSFLGFRGTEPENMAKGMWQPLSSPLVRNLSDGDMPALKSAGEGAVGGAAPGV